MVDQTSASQRLTFDGPWYSDGGGNLHITAANVSLDALTAEGGAPAQYGGTANLDAFLRGTRNEPILTRSD